MDNEKCRLLIQLYGAKNLLWNSKSPHYHNKSLRQDAWNEISSIMDLPIPDLKKKMTTLQASYRREKSRIAKSLITGSGTHEIYVSKWFAFDDFNFMKDKDLPNETSDTIPEESEDISTTQNVTTHTNNDKEPTTPSATDSAGKQVEEPNGIYSVPNTPTIRKMKRKSNTEEESPMLKKAFQILSESSSPSSDSYFTYGQHIGNELRKYDQRTLVYVKQAINNVIFEADLGKYTHCGGYYTQNYGQAHYNTPQNSTPSQSPSPQPPVPSPHPPIPSPQISTPLPPQASTLSPPPTLQCLLPPTVLSPLPLQSSPESLIDGCFESEHELINF